MALSRDQLTQEFAASISSQGLSRIILPVGLWSFDASARLDRVNRWREGGVFIAIEEKRPHGTVQTSSGCPLLDMANDSQPFYKPASRSVEVRPFFFFSFHFRPFSSCSVVIKNLGGGVYSPGNPNAIHHSGQLNALFMPVDCSDESRLD